MASVVTGNGLGLERGSGFVLGSRGSFGSALLGRAGEGVFVNATTGNLVVTNQDEFLVGLGPDSTIARTYNSQGVFDGDNGDNWRMSPYRSVALVSGVAGQSGSVVRRTDWDGTETLYNFVDGVTGYRSTDGSGAYDTIKLVNGAWEWRDGGSLIVETYEAAGSTGILSKLRFVRDRDGNQLEYAYAGNLLSRVTTQDGGYTDFVYSGNQLLRLETARAGVLERTQTRYEYEAGTGRLKSVTVDLTPGDNSVADLQLYKTSYEYDAAGRVRKISQSDGSSLDIHYDATGRVDLLTESVTSTVSRVTQFAYGVGTTTITGPDGRVTKLSYDGAGQLIKAVLPPAQAGGREQIFVYEYDPSGDLRSETLYDGVVEFGANRALLQTVYRYDARGNLVRKRDLAGQYEERSYNGDNQLLSVTAFQDLRNLDIDAANWSTTMPTLVTRYVYDAEQHLRFTVSAQGRVTEYAYDTGLNAAIGASGSGSGRLTSSIVYAGSTFTNVGAPDLLQALESWVSGASVDRTKIERTDTSYDVRGNVESVTHYGITNAAGVGTGDVEKMVYSYDRNGRLLSRHSDQQARSEVFVYDGLGRQISFTSYDNQQTVTQFVDAEARTVVTLASGLVRTSLFNKAGELVSVAESASGLATGTTSYVYDQLGRLRRVTNANGETSDILYDGAGRKVADIGRDGQLTEYRYDGASRLISTTAYKTVLTQAQRDLLVSGGVAQDVALDLIRPAGLAEDRWAWQFYDTSGQLVQQVDAIGAVTFYGYDGVGRLVTTTRAATLLDAVTLARLKAQRNTDLGNAGQWTVDSATAASASPLGGAPATLYTRTTSGTGGALRSAETAVAAGDSVTFTITVQGVGTLTSLYLGLYGSESGFPSSGVATARIVSGPGVISQTGGALAGITGLSTTTATRIEITRTFTQAEQARAFVYLSGPQNSPASQGQQIILAAPSMAVRPPSVLVQANAVQDRVSRNFYDGDGLLVGTLDGEAYLTEYLYDSAGRATGTKRYDSVSSAPGAASFEGVKAGIVDAATKFTQTLSLLDGRGNVRATVDGEGNVTRFAYDAFDQLLQQVRGRKVASGSTPSLAGLEAAYLASDAPDEITNYVHDEYGRLKEQRRTLINLSGAVVGEEVTANSYDALGNLVSSNVTSPVAGSALTETRSTRFVYDAKGRLVVSLSGKGAAALAALGAGATQAQIDTVYGRYGVRYVYDAGDRIVAKYEPNGTDASGVRTVYYYDGAGRLGLEVRDVDTVDDATHLAVRRGEVVEYGYNGFGERTDSWVYDTGVASSVVDSLQGGTLTSGIRASLNLVAANAAHIETRYDVRGLVSERIDAAANSTTLSYNSFGEVHVAQAPAMAGKPDRTTSVYDRRGLLKTRTRDLYVTSSSAAITAFQAQTWTYDALGRVESVTTQGLSGGSRLESFVYDRANRLLEQTDALSRTTRFKYDALGNQIELTDAGGNKTLFLHDAFNRTSKTITPENVETTVTRNAFGQTISLKDGENRVTSFTYDKDGNLETRTTAAGTTTNSYDYGGRLIEVQDALNHKTTYTYDDANRVLKRVQDAGTGAAFLNLGTRYEYDAAGRQVIVIDGSPLDGTEMRTRILYDDKGRVIESIADEGGETIRTTYTYWANDKVQFVREAVGTAQERKSFFEYDSAGRLTRKTDDQGDGRLNVETAYAYDDFGNMVATTDALGGVTRFVYDAGNQLRYTVDALGYVTETVYDVRGHVSKTIAYDNKAGASSTALPSSLVLSAADVSSRLDLDNAKDRVTRFWHDKDGRLAFSVDAQGYVTENRYDKANNLVRTIRFDKSVGASDATTLTGLVGLIGAVPGYAGYPATTPATAVETVYGYDNANRLTDVTDSENYTTHYGLDALGRITDTTLAYGTPDAVTIHRDYDGVGRVTLETRAYGPSDAVKTHYDYDALGRVTHVIEAYDTIDASDTFRDYDTLGRLTLETRGYGTPDASSTHYDYDKLGRVTHVKTGFGSTDEATTFRDYDATTFRDYDALGRVVLETRGQGSTAASTTQYQLDKLGHVLKTTDPRLNSGYFYYDALGRLELQLDPEGYVTKTVYGLGNSVETVTRYANQVTGGYSATTRPALPQSNPKDATTSFETDRLGRVTRSTDAENYHEDYEYDAFGNRTKLTNKLGGVTLYDYDERGLLKTETIAATQVAPQIINQYDYDARGNRTLSTEAAGTSYRRQTQYSYDRLDRQTRSSREFGATHIIMRSVYDRRGNVIETFNENLPAEKTLLFYNNLNQKIAEINAVGTLTHWDYDTQGNVTKQSVYATPVSLERPAANARPLGAGAVRETRYDYDKLNRLKLTTQVGVFTWGPSGTAALGNINRTNDYDAAGNLIRETDGRGGVIFHFYDKNGREVAKVDQERYLTSWVRDGEGNAVEEVRYAKALDAGFALSSANTPDALKTNAGVANTANRKTVFTYDKMGRRTSETRASVAISSIDGFGVMATSVANATIRYDYDGFGNVTRRIGALTSPTDTAPGETTDYDYDAFGRLIKSRDAAFVDYLGATVRHTMVYNYDALNNLIYTREGGEAENVAVDRITTYSYSKGGRMDSTTDASRTFTRNYSYDLAGRVTRESYDRTRSTGAPVTEGIEYEYDLLGKVTAQASVRGNGTAWMRGDVTRMTYNAYGELQTRGINYGAQEKFYYDGAGRLARSNTGDGVWRFYVNDANGNAALTISSVGRNTDNDTVESAYAALLAGGAVDAEHNVSTELVATIGVFDKRNQQIATREPNRDYASLDLGQSPNWTSPLRATLVRSKTYNAFGEVASETTARNYTTRFDYNTMGRLVRKTSPSVGITLENGLTETRTPVEEYYYDVVGRMIGVRSANGYNAVGYTAGVGYALDATTGYIHAQSINRDTSGKEINLSTRQVRAGTGHDSAESLQVTKEFRAGTAATQTGFDVFGQARKLTNGAGQFTLQNFDKMGNLTQIIRPARSGWGTPGNAVFQAASQLEENFVYDGLGQRTKHWVQDLATNASASAFNAAYGESHGELTEYDQQGRITLTSTYSAEVTSYAYEWRSGADWTDQGMGNFGGWVVTTTSPFSGTNGYRTSREDKDYFGRVNYRRDLGNHHFNYRYDKAGRLSEQTGKNGEQAGAGYTLNYSYFNTGKMARSFDTALHKQARYAYDKDGNRVLEQFGHWLGATSASPDFGYTPDLQNTTAQYDALGRLTGLYDTGNTLRQDARLLADSTGTNVWVDSTPVRAQFRIDHQYDANSNVRRSKTSHLKLDQFGTASDWKVDDYWYTYDAQNRFVVSRGRLSTSDINGTVTGPGAISLGTGAAASGVRLSYDNAGNRASAAYANGQTELYSYTEDGYFSWAKLDGSTTEQSRVGRDTLGRVIRTVEYKTTGDIAYVKSTIYADYDGDIQATDPTASNGAAPILTEATDPSLLVGRSNRARYEVSHTYRAEQNGGTSDYKSITINRYTDTNLTSSEVRNWRNGSRTDAKDNLFQFSYDWYDSAKQVQIVNHYDNYQNANLVRTSDVAFDTYGRMTSVHIADGQVRDVIFTNNADGLILNRYETSATWNGGTPTLTNHIFDGKVVGQIGNDGGDDNDTVSYAEAINRKVQASAGSGQFANGSTSATAWSDYDQSYQAINGETILATASSYTVRSGDTLQGIAAALWGDSSLWYLIAEANGLTGSEALAEGQGLSIPNKVANFHNNSDTFAVYDPNQAMGDISPSAPKPPKKPKCGGFGQVLIMVIAMAVTMIATAGVASLGTATFSQALTGMFSAGGLAGVTGVSTLGAIGAGVAGAVVGSVVSQAYGLATGLQDKFNWKSVALAGVGAAVGGALGGTNLLGKTAGTFANSVARGALSNALTQGIGVATGLQNKFSWAGIAVGGVVAGVTGAVGRALGDKGFLGITAKSGSFGNEILSGLAGGIAGAATRSALTGTSFGDNVLAVLPDVIGTTVGRAVARDVVENVAMGGPYEEVDNDTDIIVTANMDEENIADTILNSMFSLELSDRIHQTWANSKYDLNHGINPIIATLAPIVNPFRSHISGLWNGGLNSVSNANTWLADHNPVSATLDAFGYKRSANFVRGFTAAPGEIGIETVRAAGNSTGKLTVTIAKASVGDVPTGAELRQAANNLGKSIDRFVTTDLVEPVLPKLEAYAARFRDDALSSDPMRNKNAGKAAFGGALTVGSVLAPVLRVTRIAGAARVAAAEEVIGAEMIGAESSATARIIYDAPIGPSVPAGAQPAAIIGEARVAVAAESNVLRQTGSGSIIGSADEAYNAIRASTTDVGSIASSTGYKLTNIQKVKDHLFYNEQLLDRYVGQGFPATRARFDSDIGIAQAWRRLETGTHGPTDLQLLRHETAEAWYMRNVSEGYNAAHNAAQRRFPAPGF